MTSYNTFRGFRNKGKVMNPSQMYNAYRKKPANIISKYLGKRIAPVGKRPVRPRKNFNRNGATQSRYPGKRKLFGTKNFARKVRNVVMEQLTADNSYVGTYVDRIVKTNTTNALAAQIGWGINQVNSVAFNSGTIDNLLVDDPLFLQAITNNISASAKTSHFTRKSWECSADITNSETTPCELWEYRCQSRHDQTLTLDAVWNAGFADASVGVTAKCTVNSIGATPFMNPRLTALYKVVKVRKWIIAPGETKQIKYVVRTPKQFNAERFAPGGTALNMLKGQRCSLFVANGTYATNTSANATYQVGIGNVDLGIVYKFKCHYSWIKDETIATGVGNNVPGYSAGAAYAPIPPVLVHPDSIISTFSTTLGVNASVAGNTLTQGQRIYATGQDAFGVPDDPED